MSQKIMQHSLYVPLLGTLALLMAILAVAAPAVEAGGRPLTATLSGANEVPNPGDPDGSGLMSLTLNQGQEEICWELSLSDIAPATRAHIHAGPAGQNGGVVVFFFDEVIGNPIPRPDPLTGCVDVEADLIKDIRQNPDQFYINVHNADYPGGAVRGQLSK